MDDVESAIPAHLRQFVVRQSYDEYTEEDHAVWRFVVMQTHARLLHTAHPAYARGFDAAGITVDRIPRIDEMNERLARFGWRAACVDGFIPPRAFQAFQARGILPIAADIRTSKHLSYTPAPDIIHEAAGHAPFLAEPRYAAYVRRIGEIAQKAFSAPADREIYEAVHTLSEVKEDPSTTAAQMEHAEQALERAIRRANPASESARLSRLYWWTAEYGLVGTPSDYALYGAGLLSSIGEGHFCHRPSVRKVPLSPACMDVDFDITRAQPQLFVARNFAELDDVLDAAEKTLATYAGGERAIQAAIDSEEVATVELDGGVQVAGRVTAVHRKNGTPALLELGGPCAVAQHGVVLDGMPRPASYALPLGALEDGSPPEVSAEWLARRTDPTGHLVLRYASGVTARGRVSAFVPRTDDTGGNDGRVACVLLSEFELDYGGRELFRSPAPFPLALGREAVTTRAGAPSGYFAPTESAGTLVPKPRRFGEAHRELIGLYERGVTAWRELSGRAAAEELSRIAEHLEARFPDEWLLRWNLLESLTKLGERPETAARLERALEQLEIRYEHLEPIATGLGYIRSLVGGHEPHARAG